MKKGTKMSNASERIKGYCTEVTQAQWEELVRVADEVGVKQYGFANQDNRWAQIDEEDNDLCLFSFYNNLTVIPFPDFLAKMRGVEEWTPKAGEMVEVRNGTGAWFRKEFIAVSRGLFIVWGGDYQVYSFSHCRSIPSTITRAEAEAQLGKRIID